MKNVELNIPDMQSTHCQARVRNAISTLTGVEIQHQEAGKIAVSIETDSLENEVVKVIEKAGYTVEPGNNNA